MWKKLARGDEIALADQSRSTMHDRPTRYPSVDRKPHEGLSQAEAMGAIRELVVFGQAVGRKAVTAGGCGRGFEGLHRVAGSDPGTRHDAREPLPNVEFLAVRLGKFVHIVAADQVPPRSRQRDDWDLNKIPLRHQTIEQFETQRIDDILGVMQNHSRKADAVLGLVVADAADDP